MDWFDVTMQSAMAFNQVMILMTGGTVFIIGGVILAALVFELDDRKVKARIVALRVQGKESTDRRGKPTGRTTEVYYPIFEYADRQGNLTRAESSSGSSTLGEKIPGSEVRVTVSPHNPHKAAMPGLLLWIIALMLTGSGAWVMYYALTTYPFSPFSMAGLAMLFAWAGWKIKKSIKPRDQWEKPTEFRARRDKEFKDKREALPTIDRAEALKRLKAKDAEFRKWSPVYLVIALAVAGVGAWVTRDTLDMLSTGAGANGTVTELVLERSGDSRVYYPQVRFEDAKGDAHEFQDRTGTNPPSHRAGDAVKVLYKPDAPHRAMIDRGLWNWTVPAALMSVGGLFLLQVIYQLGVIARRRNRV